VKRILTARFLLGWNLESKVIGWRSGGLSHVDFLAADGSGWWSAYSVELPGFTPGSTIRSGCMLRPLDYYGTPKRVEVVRIEVTQEEWDAFWSLVKSTEGAPYDKTGLVDSFILMRAIKPPRKWRATDSFWCSEWWTWLLEGCKRIHPLHDMITHVDPGMALAITSSHGKSGERQLIR
jgi:hypothetical protein